MTRVRFPVATATVAGLATALALAGTLLTPGVATLLLAIAAWCAGFAAAAVVYGR